MASARTRPLLKAGRASRPAEPRVVALRIPLTREEMDLFDRAWASHTRRHALPRVDWARSLLLNAAEAVLARNVEMVAPLRDQVEAIERAALRAALTRTDENQVDAAALLGISRRKLIMKMEQYGLKAPPASRRGERA